MSNGGQASSAFFRLVLSIVAATAPLGGLVAEPRDEPGAGGLDLAELRAADDLDESLRTALLTIRSSAGGDSRGTAAAVVAPPSSKSYLRPIAEIVGFELFLNQFNRHFASDQHDYETGPGTIRRNLRRRWEFDEDPFDINQIGHPYQGGIYYGLSRAAGLNFWESAGYTTVGSYLWEIGGETTRPSINDQITTTIGGSFLGEALYRMADILWFDGNGGSSAWREGGAALVSPPLGFERLAVGTRPVPPSPGQRPATFADIRAGALRNVNVTQTNDTSPAERNLGLAGFDMGYGLPGKPGYDYDRPFDYFDFSGAVSSSENDSLANLDVRGLLYGGKYGVADSYRGIAGLYGTYDYLTPEIFRVASSAVSLGTTGEWRGSKEVALQGTVLGGAGFGAAGSIADTAGGRDYHYGAVPQGLVDLRLILGERAALEWAGREYFVSGSGSDGVGSKNERIGHQRLALSLRVAGPHAVGVEYSAASRDAFFSKADDRHQRIDSLGIYYTYLIDERFGAVRW